jgi:sulfur dioxygenase
MAKLKKRVKGLKSIISTSSKAKADIHINHLDEIHFGNRFITALATPGHTPGCMSFVTDDKKAVITGDALLIAGCGRTDLPGGSAETLYDSIYEQLFTLPDECVVLPGHDEEDRTHSTIGYEKAHNPRLQCGTTKAAFVKVMDQAYQHLARPKKMDIAIPSNTADGTEPFFVRSLRARLKDSWGIYA